MGRYQYIGKTPRMALSIVAAALVVTACGGASGGSSLSVADATVASAPGQQSTSAQTSPVAAPSGLSGLVAGGTTYHTGLFRDPLHFTTPLDMDGWTISEPEAPLTSPTGSAVRISNDPSSTPEIFLVVADGQTYDPVDLATRVAAPTTARAWLALLQRHPNLKVGTPASLSIDGHPAIQVDVVVANAPVTMPKPCADAAYPVVCVPLWGTYPSEVGQIQMRTVILTLVDVDGRPLSIIGTDTPGHLESFRPLLHGFLAGLKFAD